MPALPAAQLLIAVTTLLPPAALIQTKLTPEPVSVVPFGLKIGRSAVGLPLALESAPERSEEHTSELQSRLHLVCRLLLEKKKKKSILNSYHFIVYNVRVNDTTSLSIHH